MTSSTPRDSTGHERDSGLPPIENPYLLVSRIPFLRDGEGRLFTNRLWFHDLKEHLAYLANFTIACPVIDRSPPEGFVPLESDNVLPRLRVVPLPGAQTVPQALASMPTTLVKVWGAIRRTQIVHSPIGGWPFAPAWITTPFARVLGRHIVIIVESAPWRLQPGLPASLKARVLAFIYEHLARICLQHADLAIFTSNEYRRSLLREQCERGHVIHASWIDEANILSDEQARSAWSEKRATAVQLKLLFAGELKPAKGVLVLLDAVRRLAGRNIPLELHILGAGELASHCESAAKEMQGAVSVRMLGTVPYGTEFFNLLRQYHAVIVPSVSDEQPRIVYDAYSQAVPVLATRTAGLIDCVRDGQTGWLVEPNDGGALSALLERAATESETLQTMGLEALMIARSVTHRGMHAMRHRLLAGMTADL